MNVKQHAVMWMVLACGSVAWAQEVASPGTPAVTSEFRRPTGLRWGVSCGPGTLVFSAASSRGGVTASDTLAFGGIGVTPRIGFQINNTFGVFGEFQVAVMAHEVNNGSVTALGLSGGAALQANLGQYFYFAFGPSIGGAGLFGSDGGSAWSRVTGGFLARVGVDLLSRNRRGLGASAISLGVEARPMFAALDNGVVGIIAPILFTAGIESY